MHLTILSSHSMRSSPQGVTLVALRPFFVYFDGHWALSAQAPTLQTASNIARGLYCEGESGPHVVAHPTPGYMQHDLAATSGMRSSCIIPGSTERQWADWCAGHIRRCRWDTQTQRGQRPGKCSQLGVRMQSSTKGLRTQPA
ncbi:unnamed protein product [Mycena citricolor]|uniref:Uncharacterized protein n=1 Tax=Mycena citricolor TaxID=2018698 RepID=A0AAD2Q445_9AGAR|nr:unnamed protein product [Mycena citricolor]